MKYHQFKVENSRFWLNDPCRFSLRGTIPEGWDLRAELDDTPVKLTWERSEARGASEHLHDSEHPGSMRVEACVFLPESLSAYRCLKVFGIHGQERHLWYRRKISTLLKYRNRPHYYLEKEQVDPKAGTLRIQGWAVAASPVRIRLFDQEKRPVPFTLQLMSRTDVKDLFRECPVEEECGFVLEASGLRGKRLYLVLKAQEGKKVVHPISLSTAGAVMSKGEYYARKAADRLRTGGVRGLFQRNRPVDYGRWLSAHLPDEEELRRERSTLLPRMPLISVIAALDHPKPANLRRMAESVKAQTYSRWELILVTGEESASSPKKRSEHDVLEKLLSELAEDPRVKFLKKDLDRAGKLNCGAAASQGDLLAFCGGEDLLEPHSLFSLAEAWGELPAPDLLYSDEDRLSVSGKEYSSPHMKPDYNPDLLAATNYISHLLAVTRGLFDEAGGFCSGFSGAEEYDFILRCTEQASHIRHIPKILYHWRMEEERGGDRSTERRRRAEAGRRAIQAHYDRLGISAEVREGEYEGLYRARFALPGEPLVSILIPNKDHREDLKRCIVSIEEKSTYRNFEYIIVENNSEEEETFAYYKELEASSPRIRVVRWDGPFNYSDINNYGASFARGEYLLLLNNDTKVISGDWLEELLGYCVRPDVGAVGARLYYEDNTIQHAGVVLGFGGIAGHCFVQQPRENSGYYHRIISPQNYSAVTAACMMVKKSAFDQVGGLSPELAVAFNDIDFCLKLGRAGYRIVYNPYAELYHYESKSRGLEDTPEKEARFIKEISILESRWPEVFSRPDPYYNPNLSLKTQDFSLKEL